MFILFSSAIFANPQGPNVVHGNAAFKENGPLLEIKTSHKAILNWEAFSIKSGETTQFTQPSTDSAVLNRVTGNNLSEIMGTLNANGRVYLVNPNGIVIGEEGRIDAEAFFASVIDIQDGEFLSGDTLHLDGDSLGQIINLGHIQTNSGPISIVAHRIENYGTLSAPENTVSLSSGHSLLLDPTGDALIYIQPDIKAEGIDNAGRIEAFKTQIQADVPIYSLAISHEGVIEATCIEEVNGEVYLVANEGRVECQGSVLAPSGTVHILGESVYLLDGSVIDASGDFAGGTVLIGGDFQGKNPEIPNAQAVFCTPGARVDVSALKKGDAGKAIFWGDEGIAFSAHVDANGGPQGGDGGFVEVSSPKHFEFNGLVSRLAPKGKAGTLLLDPTTININAGATAGGSFGGGPPFTFSGAGASATLNYIDLQNQLALGDVIVTAASGGGGVGNISVNIPGQTLTWSANTLTFLPVFAFINFTPIQTTGSAGLIITAPAYNISGGMSLSGSGTHTITSTGSLGINGDVTVSGSTALEINTTTGFSVSTILNILDSASLDLTIGTDFDLLGFTSEINYSSSVGQLNITCPGDIDFGGGTINITGGVPLIASGNSITGMLNTVNSNGPLSFTSSTFISSGSNSFYNSTSGDVTFNATGGSIFLADSFLTSAGNVTLTSTGQMRPFREITAVGNITLTTPDEISLDGGTLVYNTTGTISFNGSMPTVLPAFFPTFVFSLSSTSQSIVFPNGLNSLGTNDFTINTAGSVTLGSNATLGGWGVTAGGTIDIQGGSVSVSTHRLSLDAGQSVLLGDNTSLSVPTVNPLSITAGSSNIQMGNNVSISGNSTVDLIAGASIFSTGSTGLIQTVNANDLTIVSDNSNPNPPSFGNGFLSFPEGFSLRTNSGGGGATKVLLFASVPGESTFPSTINNEIHTPGAYDSTLYVPGVNEFVGFWYITQPPPDPPLFQIMYKSGGIAPSVVQTIEVSVTEPVANPTQISQITEGNLQTPSIPDPKTPCRTPPVAVQGI